MDDSAGWRRYFELNAGSLLDIPWDTGPDLTPDEASAIASSIQEFQAGERSEGRHLYRAAQEYSQCGQLRRLRARRSTPAAAVTYALQQGLYAGTLLVVWWSHRRVIRRGGMTFVDWVVACQRQFRNAMTLRPSAAARRTSSAVSP